MPWNIDVFLKRSFHYKNNCKLQSLRDILRQIVWKNTHFDKLECQGIVSLMENGFSFTDTLQILKTKRNEHRIIHVLEKLEQGQTFKEAFSMLLPKGYRRYFNNFIRYLPVLESMRISVELATHEEKMKQKMMKDMVYPVVMLFVMFIGMYLFNGFVFPQMMTLMTSFEINVTSYYFLRSFIQLLSWLVTILLVVGLLLWVVFQEPNRKCWLYRVLVKYVPDSLMVQKASAEFARYFLECVRVRISTIQTMKILLDIKEKPLVRLIAKELNDSLSKGESFEETLHTPFVEHALQQFFQIALHGSNCEKMLEGYLVMNQQRHIKQVRIFTRSVQLSCYGTIGLILLVIYQILMLPMQMLQNI